MNKIPVNALVRVTTNNELDFNEWLDYHIALGFNRIFVYDTGNHGWLAEACRRRAENVVLVPMANNDWRKKRNIIASYVSISGEPSWAVLMEDDEFIWLDFKVARSISDYMNVLINRSAGAMSIYVKYLSSEKPMKNRVGTLIDCFQHARPNPQGLVHPCSHTPNYALTMFFVPNSKFVPMRGPLTPTDPNWRDSLGALINEATLGKYLVDRSYNPDRYPVRCYKYGLKSGMEMGMAPGTCPVGYTVLDTNMLKAREMLLRIPANEATEQLFAKSEAIVEQPKLPKRELSPDELAELELPLPLGKIDTYILYGHPVDAVFECAVKAGYEDTVEHRAVIERVYRRECNMIIESSPVYVKLAELDAEGGRTDEMVCAELKINKSVLAKMRKCVEVLDIAGYKAAKQAAEEKEKQADAEKAKEIVEKNDIADLAQKFDTEVAAAPITTEDAERFDKTVEERRAKRRESAKKAREKKRENEKAKKKSLESKPEAPKAEPENKVETSAPVKDDVDLDNDNLLTNTDLSAFGVIDA